MEESVVLAVTRRSLSELEKTLDALRHATPDTEAHNALTFRARELVAILDEASRWIDLAKHEQLFGVMQMRRREYESLALVPSARE
jgi:hypothetical protein